MTKSAILFLLALQATHVDGLVVASKVSVLHQNLDKVNRTSSATDSVAAAWSRVSASARYVFGQAPMVSGQPVTLSPIDNQVFRIGVYAVFVLLSGFLYQKHVLREYYPVPAEPAELPGATRCGFQFSCIDYGGIERDWKLCCCAFFCPLLVWAGTASRSVKPFMGFWEALGMVLLLLMLYPGTHGWSGFLILALFLARRRQLRDVYHHSRNKVRTWAEDLCLVFCCNSFLCCQLLQEAREVEYIQGCKEVKEDEEGSHHHHHHEEYKSPPTAYTGYQVPGVDYAPIPVQTLPPIHYPLSSSPALPSGPLPATIMAPAPSMGHGMITTAQGRPTTTAVVGGGVHR